ncbi:MAG: methylmalonyl-CoA epimerase [Candidatus Aminicenantes bacterium]|nr:methylmalonyl-CoA epimerase [Candidatus Aminicenantes bacterium]
MIKKIDHIAIAVTDLDEEIKRYRDVLGLEFHGAEVVADQKVKVAFFSVGDIHIELTAPTEEDSPVGKFIAKRGAGIHHIAYEVDDLGAQIKAFQEKDIKMIDSEPRTGAGNCKIAFAHPKSFSGVLVELKQK